MEGDFIVCHVAICIPSSDIVLADFCTSLANAVNFTRNEKEVTISIVSAKSSVLTDNRNRLVQSCQKANDAGAGVTHVMFFDTDMIFPQDTIVRLLKQNKDFVCASYVRRTPPHNDLVARLRAGELREGNLLTVAGAPLGVSITKIDVFDKIKMPYFGHDYVFGDELEKGSEKLALYADILPEKISPAAMYPVTEDYWFTSRIREAGLDVWVDLELTNKIGHVGYATYRQPNN